MQFSPGLTASGLQALCCRLQSWRRAFPHNCRDLQVACAAGVDLAQAFPCPQFELSPPLGSVCYPDSSLCPLKKVFKSLLGGALAIT